MDPHAFFFDAFFVLIHLMKRDYETAVEVGRSVSQLNPLFTATYKPYLAALGHLHRDQEAATIRRRLLALEPDFTIERFLKQPDGARKRQDALRGRFAPRWNPGTRSARGQRTDRTSARAGHDHVGRNVRSV